MRAMMTSLRKVVSNFWNFLKEVAGENDYRRYRARMGASGRQPITAREFYLERQQQKYARPNRCC